MGGLDSWLKTGREFRKSKDPLKWGLLATGIVICGGAFCIHEQKNIRDAYHAAFMSGSPPEPGESWHPHTASPAAATAIASADTTLEAPPNLSTGGVYLKHINARNFGDAGPMKLGPNVYVVDSMITAPHGVIQNGVQNYNAYIQGDPVIQNGVQNVGGAIKNGPEATSARDGGER